MEDSPFNRPVEGIREWLNMAWSWCIMFNGTEEIFHNLPLNYQVLKLFSIYLNIYGNNCWKNGHYNFFEFLNERCTIDYNFCHQSSFRSEWRIALLCCFLQTNELPTDKGERIHVRNVRRKVFNHGKVEVVSCLLFLLIFSWSKNYENMFKEKFKYFRRKKPRPDFKSVISLENVDTRLFSNVQLANLFIYLSSFSINSWEQYLQVLIWYNVVFYHQFQLRGVEEIHKSETSILGLKDVNDWTVYELRKYPGDCMSNYIQYSLIRVLTVILTHLFLEQV